MKRAQAEVGFKVQRKMCKTCIFRPHCAEMLPGLLKQIADPRMPGYFKGHRTCHHAPNRSGICCRGFWEAHKDHFTAGQLAQRLDCVIFVDVDNRGRR